MAPNTFWLSFIHYTGRQYLLGQRVLIKIEDKEENGCIYDRDNQNFQAK